MKQNFDTLPTRIVEAIRKVVGSSPVALHEPTFSGNEWKYVKECIDTSFVSSVGKFVDRFELDLAQFTGAKHAIAVVNGTAALHISLKLAGVNSGEEVLIPSLTFVATANAVTYCGAIPHFVDSEESTLGLDPIRIREYLSLISEIRNSQCVNKATGRIIRAIVPMHTFGHSSDLDGILKLAEEFHLKLIEDAAESLGSYYRDRHTGTLGLFGTISFNGNKTITTGGGGAILTDNSELAKRAKHITTTAKVPHRWEYVHDQIGYNYRMPNINAALGCAQLEQMPEFLKLKRELFLKYKDSFSSIEGVSLFEEPNGTRSNYWLQTLVLADHVSHKRDEILTVTNDNGVMTRPCWGLMHKLIPFSECPRMDLSVALSLEKRLINIPSGSGLLVSKSE
ncbi:LegC family aminotransferase [Leptospira stimsonii]|uniref:LegC family aminotransferase n=1 Tax=Leptospira stimsonii TaxID=2202203 RepID=A0ABY2MVY2_9LEPT|nr:LegC family aminotransferase [Leptospira stimsonii]TGK14575.1 LegC family aminotransferase [Leptospira stimsonii]TGM09998.1 LegC family aminotransferase [Leptospira stimsonii]